PYIQTVDGTSVWEFLPAPSIVLVNPPFTRVIAPPSCRWGRGLVSQAALFLDCCVGQPVTPLSIYAILPDVLRTGSRYAKWRKIINEVAQVSEVTPIGLFDRWTDVDVFTARLKVGTHRSSVRLGNWGVPSRTETETVGTKFDIRVGSVV